MILDINKQRVQDDYVELFILETNSTPLYFTTYHEDVYFADKDSPYTARLYEKLPIEFSGFEHRSEGAYARPQVTFANVLRTLQDDVTPDSLIGKKITRRKTLSKYLTTSGASGTPPTELPQQIFIIDRMAEENAAILSFELTTAFDLEGVSVPNRFILGNVCSWLYQGRAPDLPSGTTPLGACRWRKDNVQLHDSNFVVTFDSANRVLLNSTYIPGALAYPTSGALAADKLYKRDITTLTYSSDGTSAGTQQEYYQALGAFDAVPFSQSHVRRVRPYSTWSSSTTYRTFSQGTSYNPCVIYNNSSSINHNKIYVAITDSDASNPVTPGTNENYWRRIDTCGKALTSCAVRYRAKKYSYVGDGSNTVIIPYYTTQNREEVLPYGGFPAAKRYNR